MLTGKTLFDNNLNTSEFPTWFDGSNFDQGCNFWTTLNIFHWLADHALAWVYSNLELLFFKSIVFVHNNFTHCFLLFSSGNISLTAAISVRSACSLSQSNWWYGQPLGCVVCCNFAHQLFSAELYISYCLWWLSVAGSQDANIAYSSHI